MNRAKAFTLVELLVALAITSVLVVLLANVVSATLTAWQQGRNRLDTYSNARQLIGRLTDEIKGSVAAKDRIQFVENDAGLKGASDPVPGSSENLFFVAPYPNSYIDPVRKVDVAAGDLCVIAYRHDAKAQKLERAFKDSYRSWSVGATDRYRVPGYTTGSTSSPFEWRTVSEGVVEFEIRAYSKENLDKNEDPVDAWNSGDGDPAMEGKTPRRIMVRLKVVDDRTLTRLRAMTPDTEPYKAQMQRGAREFVADLNLPSS